MDSTSGPSNPGPQQPTARLAELIAALSLATGLGMGQAMDLPLRIATLAVELGRRLAPTTADLAEIYYLALVGHIGCTSDSLEFAAFTGGDDIALRRRMMTWASAAPPELLLEIVGYVGRGKPPLQRARLAAVMLLNGQDRARHAATSHCEAGSRLAERFGLSSAVRIGLAQEQERWGRPGSAGRPGWRGALDCQTRGVSGPRRTGNRGPREARLSERFAPGVGGRMTRRWWTCSWSSADSTCSKRAPRALPG